MWSDIFRRIQANYESLEARFLDGRIAFRGIGGRRDPTADADAALSVLAHRLKKPVEIAFVHPDLTPAKAREVLLATAFAELMRGLDQRNTNEPAGILYITQQIVDARLSLSSVRVKNQNIGDVFNIASLTSAPTTNWRNLLISNPGRALQNSANAARVRAMVIDASHPRTLNHLPALLHNPDLRQIPFRIIVAPPHRSLLEEFGERLIWLWDPDLACEVFKLLTPTNALLPGWACRTYWVAPDSGMNQSLGAAEKKLTEILRISKGQFPSEVSEAWSILCAERSLCIPLEQAERAWRNSHNGGRLRDRLDVLQRVTPNAEGELKNFLAMYWKAVVDDLETAYQILKGESTSQKFLTLIDVLDEFMHRLDVPLRIVTSNREEAPILATNIADLDNGLRSAIDCGCLEIVHQHEEARRVAVGNNRTTILTGARSNRHRYLDLFPSQPVHIVAYSSEATRDRYSLESTYSRWAPWANGKRVAVGATLNLNVEGQNRTLGWKALPIRTRTASSANSISATETPTPELDVFWFADEGTNEEHQNVGYGYANAGVVRRTRITTIDGDAIEITNRRTVDVYRPETDMLLRVSPDKVMRGDYLVTLLDDPYESLFDRLCEVASLKRPTEITMRLENWKLAKSRIFQAHYGEKKAIYRALDNHISVDYPAMKEWFGSGRDEDAQCLGPREKADFEQLAALSGVYSVRDMEATFETIELERNNHRRLGRQLCGAIRALARQHSSDRALKTAAALDAEVEEVRDALELHEVASIEKL